MEWMWGIRGNKDAYKVFGLNRSFAFETKTVGSTGFGEKTRKEEVQLRPC